MSRENVEIVRRVFDAAARRDSATVLSLYDPEVEWDNSRGPFSDLFGREVYRGHEGVRRFLREYYAPETWQSVEDHLEELIDAGANVVSVAILGRGVGRAGSRSSGRTTRGSGRSATAGSCASRGMARWTKPSKPPGCGSRRFRPEARDDGNR